MNGNANAAARDINSAKPFETYYARYRAKGWLGTLPLPARKKETPPDNFTGYRPGSKLYPEQSDIDGWLADPRWFKGNICLRLGQQHEVDGKQYEVIGIDVDHYEDKRGGDVLASLETQFGQLPPTWIATSRTDGVSGIRFYRVPPGYAFAGKVGESIECIQRRHRYAVVYPSWHPKTGNQYRWYSPGSAPDGVGFSDDLPDPKTLPLLPEKWLEHLTRGYLADNGSAPMDLDSKPDEVMSWAATTFVDATGKMCRHLEKRLQARQNELASNSDNHDPMTQAHWEILNMGAEGHHGWLTALRDYDRFWLADIAAKNKRSLSTAKAEMWRSRLGTLRKIKGAVDAGTKTVGTQCPKPVAPQGNTGSGGGNGGGGNPPPNPPTGPPPPPAAGGNGLPPRGTTIPGPAKPSELAEWLLSYWRQNGRPLIVKLNEYYQYNGRYWEQLEPSDLMDELYAILDRCVWIKTNAQGNATAVPFDPDEPKLRKLDHALKHKAAKHPNLKENSWFDGREVLVIPCNNGLVRVEDNVLLPHTSEYFCTFAVETDYDSNATCPQTDAFIKHLASQDAQSARLLYEWMGYVLSGSNKYQKGLLFKGVSGCGKGAYSRLLHLILGRNNYTTYKVEDYKRNSFPKEPLLGKSLVVFSDNRVDFDSKVFVDLTLEVVGQDSTSIRLPYARKSLNVYLPCRFMVLTNMLPNVVDDSGAFVRRFVALDCTNMPQTNVVDIELQLFTELPGILNRMVQGLQRLHARGGFEQPAVSAWVLEAMKEMSSVEKEFVTEMCDIGPLRSELHRVSRDDLYKKYVNYCNAGDSKPLTKTKFGEALMSMGGIELHKRGTRQEKQQWYFEGIRLKKDSDGRARIPVAGLTEADAKGDNVVRDW